MTSDEAFEAWLKTVDQNFNLTATHIGLMKTSWNAALEYAKTKNDPTDWSNAPEWARFKAQDANGEVVL